MLQIHYFYPTLKFKSIQRNDQFHVHFAESDKCEQIGLHDSVLRPQGDDNAFLIAPFKSVNIC